MVFVENKFEDMHEYFQEIYEEDSLIRGYFFRVVNGEYKITGFETKTSDVELFSDSEESEDMTHSFITRDFEDEDDII